MALAERTRERLVAAERTTSKRRRRPSGEPPPLPRPLSSTGKYWIALVVVALLSWVGVIVITGAGAKITRFDLSLMEPFAELRTTWLTRLARWTHTLGSEWVILILRWGVIAALLFFKRLRHLFVFIGSIVAGGLVTTVAAHAIARPRPFDIDILGHWQGSAHPSRPLGALAITLLGIAYALVVPGRPRTIAKWAIGVLLIVLIAARLYLAVEHPTDTFAGVICGIAIPLIAFRLLTPNDAFPVSYRRRRAAHLDVDGERGEAIRTAVETQLGVSLVDMEPFGLGGSAGSTPLRLRVGGEPPAELFGKLYAQNHLRADRWYKLGRTLLYGRLEDEASFSTVRRLVQYEDYLLRAMRDAGLPTPRPFGFVEITPEREYVLITDFVPGAKELLEAEVDDEIMDQSLAIVRRLWDAGLAHRDIKPSNLLVARGKVYLIDVAFGEVRPSPWRQAVDLANMMLVLALRADAERVYRAALRHFSPDDIAEAFAATRGMTMPSQTRSLIKRLMKSETKDLVDEFRRLAPPRAPISIQRWSIRRIGLTVGVLAGALLTLTLAFSNLAGAGLRPPRGDAAGAYSSVGKAPRCQATDPLILMAQSVPSATLLPCIQSLPVGWSYSGFDVVDGKGRFFLDSDRAGFHAVDITLTRTCETGGATEVLTDEPGARRFERVVLRQDRYAGSRYYLFPGGCAVYRFDFSGPGRTGLAEEVSLAVSFFSRTDANQRLQELGFSV